MVCQALPYPPAAQAFGVLAEIFSVRPWPPENHRKPFFIPRHLFLKDDDLLSIFFPFDDEICCIVSLGFLQKRIFLTFMAKCFVLLGTFFKSMMETEG